MKAIIMAGGEGSRLRPMTCTCPKPMMRLMGKPLMEYAICLLKRHGIDEIAATLGYLPEAIMDHFDDGADFGVKLVYYTEKTPLGTAGGVKQAEKFLDETFVVLSGDGVTDLDLSAAFAFHREKRALATMVLKRVENPLEYGVVVTGADGRVRSFHEKPGWGEVLSDTVNTGVYILEPELLRQIPSDRPCDFGRELFPALVAADEAVYGYVTEAYWCDVGDTAAYLQTHIDALEGKIQLEPLLSLSGAVTRMPGAQIDRTAVLESPCFIGENAQIHAGAHIGAYSVIGADASVGTQAGVKRSVLLSGAQMLAGAQARGCVLGAGSVLGAGAQAFEESVLGAGAVLGARAVAMPGVKIWPEKRVPDGEKQQTNLVWGLHTQQLSAGNGGIHLRTPDHAVRAAQSYAAQLRPSEVLLARTGSAVSAAMWHACAAGLASQGVQVIDAGLAPLPQLRHMQLTSRLRAAALVSEDVLIALDAHGAPLSRRAQRAIATLLARQDYAAPFSGITRPAYSFGKGDLSYIGATSALFVGDAKKAPSVAVFSPQNALLTLAERTFTRAGLRVRAEWEETLMPLDTDEVGVWLSGDGESAALAIMPEPTSAFDESFGVDPEGLAEQTPSHLRFMDALRAEANASDPFGRFNEAEMQLMRAWIALEKGDRLILEQVSATRALDALAESYGARVEYSTLERALWLDRLSVSFPLQFLLQTDGLALAISALSALSAAGITAAQWRRSMPHTNRLSRTVNMALSQRGRILHALADAESSAELGGGIRFPHENGWAWVCPDDVTGQCRIVSESANAEFARELCDFYETSIEKLLRDMEK